MMSIRVRAGLDMRILVVIVAVVLGVVIRTCRTAIHSRLQFIANFVHLHCIYFITKSMLFTNKVVYMKIKVYLCHTYDDTFQCREN